MFRTLCNSRSFFFPKLAFRKIGKVNFSVCVSLRRIGTADIWLHTFIISTRDEGEWSVLHPYPNHFTLEEKIPRYPLRGTLSGHQCHARNWGKQMDLWPLPGIETQSLGRLVLSPVCSMGDPSKRPVLEEKNSFWITHFRKIRFKAINTKSHMSRLLENHMFVTLFTTARLYFPS